MILYLFKYIGSQLYIFGGGMAHHYSVNIKINDRIQHDSVVAIVQDEFSHVGLRFYNRNEQEISCTCLRSHDGNHRSIKRSQRIGSSHFRRGCHPQTTEACLLK